MFLLDTNVVSELRKVASGKADDKVELWANATPALRTFISTITIFELERGICLVERKDNQQGHILRNWLENNVFNHYRDRIISVDTNIARRCAVIQVPDPLSPYDAFIAATALEHNLVVVTRNVSDFEQTGVRLLNPWE